MHQSVLIIYDDAIHLPSPPISPTHLRLPSPSVSRNPGDCLTLMMSNNGVIAKLFLLYSHSKCYHSASCPFHKVSCFILLYLLPLRLLVKFSFCLENITNAVITVELRNYSQFFVLLFACKHPCKRDKGPLGNNLHNVKGAVSCESQFAV